MSDTPDNNNTDTSEGNEATEGHQEPANQETSPQTGAGQSGQAQGSPQQPGQPQGGYQQGQQQVQTGPSIGDIFNRQDTMAEIKYGVVILALLGVGIGIGMFGVTNALTGGAGGGFAGLSLLSLLALPFVVGVIGTMVLAERQNDDLDEVANNLVYATIAVTGFVGTVVAFLIAWILAGLGAGNVGFNGIFVPMLLGALGAAVAGAGVVWADRSLLSSSPAQAQQPQPHQQSQR